MEPLQHPHTLHVNAAQGWLELGNSTEASAELEALPSEVQDHPDVLEVRWRIAVQGRRWAEGLSVAELLCQLVPDSPFGWIHRSYCLHELGRTREAWDKLLPKADQFIKEWLIPYNLACYAAQLGWLEQAKSWFMRAIEIGDPLEINRLAVDDPDLKPLFQQKL